MRNGPVLGLAAFVAAMPVGSAALAEGFALPDGYRASATLVEGHYTCRSQSPASHSVMLLANGTYVMTDLAAGGGTFRLEEDGSIDWLSGPFAASQGDQVAILAMNARRAEGGEPVVVLRYVMPGVTSHGYCFRGD